MNDFLTAKEVIDLLKIDRTTLYRMIKEERIKGIKIGSQWRFLKKEIDSIVNPETAGSIIEGSAEVLPIHCIGPIQDVFSDMAQVAAVTTDHKGVPISEFSNPCRFCNLILSSKEGKKRCHQSWLNIEIDEKKGEQFVKCHAGLFYTKADISIDNNKVAMLVTGQFYIDKTNRDDEEIRISKLAGELGIGKEKLLDAAGEITVIDDRMKQFVGKWLKKVVRSFEIIGLERKELMNKLRNIAEISNF